MDIITLVRPSDESILDGVTPISEADPSYAIMVSIERAYASPVCDSDHVIEEGSLPGDTVDG